MFKQLTMYKWEAWAVALLSLGWGGAVGFDRESKLCGLG